MIQDAEVSYNGYTITLRPLTIADFPLLLEKYEPQIRTAMRIIRDARATKQPAAIEFAHLRAFAELGPALVHALAISAGAPDAAAEFAGLPFIVQMTCAETVWLLTKGDQTGSSINDLVTAAIASLSLPETAH